VHQAGVAGGGLRLQVRHRREAPLRPLADSDLSQTGIRPGAAIDVRLDLRQESRCLRLRRERVRSRLLDSVGAEITDLPTSRRQPPNATESAATSHTVTRLHDPIRASREQPRAPPLEFKMRAEVAEMVAGIFDVDRPHPRGRTQPADASAKARKTAGHPSPDSRAPATSPLTRNPTSDRHHHGPSSADQHTRHANVRLCRPASSTRPLP
jgi:hypothetical protein